MVRARGSRCPSQPRPTRPRRLGREVAPECAGICFRDREQLHVRTPGAWCDPSADVREESVPRRVADPRRPVGPETSGQIEGVDGVGALHPSLEVDIDSVTGVGFGQCRGRWRERHSHVDGRVWRDVRLWPARDAWDDRDRTADERRLPRRLEHRASRRVEEHDRDGLVRSAGVRHREGRGGHPVGSHATRRRQAHLQVTPAIVVHVIAPGLGDRRCIRPGHGQVIRSDREAGEVEGRLHLATASYEHAVRGA